MQSDRSLNDLQDHLPVSSKYLKPDFALDPSGLPSMVWTLRDFFASRGTEAYLVGGIVRDALLGRATDDIDVAVAGDARGLGGELASFLGGRPVLLDETRDIVRVVVPSGEGVSHMDLSPMPDGIAADLERRDFTVDAMAVPLPDASDGDGWRDLIDPHGGLSDLRAGMIRSMDESVFEADPARLMRGPRLAAQLRFGIAEETRRQIQRRAHIVTMVAPERIRDELLKLLAESGAAASLRLLDELGLLCRVVPELASAKGVVQPKEHYWDVFDHLVETVASVEGVVEAQPDGDAPAVDSAIQAGLPAGYFAQEASDGHTRLTLLKLAGLLHDVAKPATKTVESSGRIRFLGHHSEGAEMAQTILRRLRLSGHGVGLVRAMVQHHLRPGQMSQKGELPTGRAIYRYFRDAGDAAIDTLYLNMADYLAARGPYLQRDEWLEYLRVIGHILREGLDTKAPESLPKLIDGHDIMAEFSVGPGPRIGTLLDIVQEAQSSAEIATKEEALELVKSRLGQGEAGA